MEKAIVNLEVRREVACSNLEKLYLILTDNYLASLESFRLN